MGRQTVRLGRQVSEERQKQGTAEPCERAKSSFGCENIELGMEES